MNKKSIEVKLIYTVLIIFFTVFLVFPAISIIKEALSSGESLSLANFSKVFKAPDFLQAVINSITISSISSIITLILATILAYTVHFTNSPKWFKKIISIIAVLPMLLPTMTYGFAIIYSFGKQGLVTKIFDIQIFGLYGFTGMLIGYVIYTLPIAYMLISNSLLYVDKKFNTVSKLMGDNSIRTYIATFIRPIIGTLGAAFVQSFFLCFTDFGIPSAIAGNYKVIATTLYNTMLGSVPDFGKGAVVAIAMIIPSVISITLLAYLDKFNFRYDKSTNIALIKNKTRDILYSLLSTIILLCICLMFAVIFILPFIEMWPYKLNFTLKHFTDILNSPQLSLTYKNSVLIAILTGTLGTILAYCAAIVTQRSKIPKKLKMIIESIAITINTIPGMVLGIAFLFVFTGTSLQNTIIILVISNIIHFFSTPYLMLKNSLSKLNTSFESTAKLMGDSWIKTIIRIITPNVKNTILEAFEYYFINSMVTISAVIFLAGAKTMIITSKIKELQYMAKFDQIFVFSLLIFATNLLVKLITRILSNKKIKAKGD